MNFYYTTEVTLKKNYFISTQTIFTLCDLYWVEFFSVFLYTIFTLCDLYWVGVSHCTHVTNFSLPSFSMWGHIRPPCTIQPHITTMLLQARIYYITGTCTRTHLIIGRSTLARYRYSWYLYNTLFVP